MAFKMQIVLLSLLCLTSTFTVTLAQPGYGYGWGWGSRGSRGSNDYSSLSSYFYDYSCPQANDIVISVLENAIAREPRMAASLLRLHFHDCFVQVCTFCVCARARVLWLIYLVIDYFY